MKIIQLLFIILITDCRLAYTQEPQKISPHDNLQLHHPKTHSVYKKIPFVEIPDHRPEDDIINHTGFTLFYNEKHEQALWVAYELTKEETNNIYHRTNKFIPDPAVKTETANDNDYLGSGYDRGHLAPASDMGWSAQTMFESFYYSNMSPQTPSFNRGIWKKLEELVRTWAISYDSIYVVTGPVLKEGLPQIGKNKVSVPENYYKVILDLTDPEVKGIGFIMKNESSTEELSNFAVSIDSVEKCTGINFFPHLADELEKKIEGSLCIECWTWKPIKISSQKINTSSPYSGINQETMNENKLKPKEEKDEISEQCKGHTQSGKRCKRKTNSPNNRCFQHGGN